MSSDRPGKNNSSAATRDSDRNERDRRANAKSPDSSAPEFAIPASGHDPTDQDEPSSLNELLAGDSKNANKVHQLVDAFDTAQPRSARDNKKNPPADSRARDASVGTAKPRKGALQQLQPQRSRPSSVPSWPAPLPKRLKCAINLRPSKSTRPIQPPACPHP